MWHGCKPINVIQLRRYNVLQIVKRKMVQITKDLLEQLTKHYLIHHYMMHVVKIDVFVDVYQMIVNLTNVFGRMKQHAQAKVVR